MITLKQSDQYIKFKQHSGWNSNRVSDLWVLYKQAWYIGRHARIEQMPFPPDKKKLLDFLNGRRIRQIGFEANADFKGKNDLRELIRFLAENGVTTRNFYDSSATKEIVIDTSVDFFILTSRFTTKKRKEIRRARKNNFVVKKSLNIDDFIQTKVISSGNRHLVLHHKIKFLPKYFGSSNVPVVSLYTLSGEFVGANVSVIWKNTAYYWGVGVTQFGQKNLASNILVIEMLKFIQELGVSKFNFGGVWDERIPNINKGWKGIDYFKRGFGGNYVYLPIVNSK